MTQPVSTLDILGIKVRSLGFEEALADLEATLRDAPAQRRINFLNANNSNLAATNKAYRAVLSRSEVLADGVGVDVAAQLLEGCKFPANLNGTDLVPALLVHLKDPCRIALIGAEQAVLEKACANFQQLAPWHTFRALSDGYFDRNASENLLAELAAFEPDITLVAMGSPAQELWIDQHFEPRHGRLVFGVGALFDFVSGKVRRAPSLMRELRLEWLYRLYLEPSRLWRRYILGNPVFLLRVLRYRLKRPTPRPAATA
ncbi:WecB/TagA/CpsF family glycosyltransferase [Pseudohoeflea coraliihabitans]|uniref:WecB/TagA/CpsF family glycosyltransferase n=1 Tax=Pseudohoeflea coraliihabitans TaxID=2860393 RepID=A0ABS6WQF8_9HYPH|nr:WecB/TagA/CpsF family glycosyltransferase [Pseudohoeflea sp. DP4N28-3]MBW3098000.1 WecB/TagA/CpsF family glycosyltransferase [Pseudohoeflea sp. DP4N28-3]